MLAVACLEFSLYDELNIKEAILDHASGRSSVCHKTQLPSGRATGRARSPEALPRLPPKHQE